MNKLKKSISLLLVAVMILPLGTFAFGEETDISNHWAKEEVQYLMGKEVVSGYSDGNFKPDQEVTRAEFFKIINNTLGYSEKAKIQFNDVEDGDWFYDEIAKAVEAGYAGGYDDGTMKPNKPITRQEASKIIGIAFGLDENKSKSASSFVDNSQIPDWAKGYVGILKDKEYVSGYSDGTFGPKNEITRAEVAKIITNASGNIINAQGEYSKNADGNVLINTPNVRLKDMHIKGDLYLAEGIGEGDISLDNVIVDGDIYIRGSGGNNINIKDSKLGKAVIKKASKDVNVILEGTTKVSSIVADNNTKLDVREGVSVDSIKVVGKSNIEVAKGAEVGKLEVEAKDTEIKSEGKIGSLVSTEDVKVNEKEVKKGTEIKVENGKVKEVKKEEGKKKETPTPAPSTGGSGGGSSSGGGGSSDKPDPTPTPEEVAVSAISVNKTEMRLVAERDTGTLEATVSPTNTTNKTVTWTSSDTDVATVVGGVVTPVTAGTATIIAKAGDKIAEVTVTVYDEIKLNRKRSR